MSQKTLGDVFFSHAYKKGAYKINIWRILGLSSLFADTFMEYGPFGWCHSPLHDVTSDLNTIPVWIFFPIPASDTTILASDTTMILPKTQRLSMVIHGEHTHSVCRCIQFYTCNYWKTACFLWYDLHSCFFFILSKLRISQMLVDFRTPGKDEELHASQDDEVSDMAQDVELATIRWCTKKWWDSLTVICWTGFLNHL